MSYNPCVCVCTYVETLQERYFALKYNWFSSMYVQRNMCVKSKYVVTICCVECVCTPSRIIDIFYASSNTFVAHHVYLCVNQCRYVMKNKKNFLDACVYETMNSPIFFLLLLIRKWEWRSGRSWRPFIHYCYFVFSYWCNVNGRIVSLVVLISLMTSFLALNGFLTFLSFLLEFFRDNVRLFSCLCKNE